MKHPGFAKVQDKIEKEGYSKKESGAILASKTRHASKKAKEENPRLKRVKSKHKGKKHEEGKVSAFPYVSRME